MLSSKEISHLGLDSGLVLELVADIDCEGMNPDDRATIDKYAQDVILHLAPKPSRLYHSLSVAHESQRLADVYGVDGYKAAVAGLLHDWDKLLGHDEIIQKADDLGIDLGVDLKLVQPLLHGLVSRITLKDIYPELDEEILEAIGNHTIASTHMSDLDKVVFIADTTEPRRKANPQIERLRALVGQVSLDDLFWECFVGGINYVLQTKRYLYPGTIEIYNEIVLSRLKKCVEKEL